MKGKEKQMKQCYIKTKNNMYLISESLSLVIERGRINSHMIPFNSIVSAKRYVKRISKEPHMKKFLPLKIEILK